MNILCDTYFPKLATDHKCTKPKDISILLHSGKTTATYFWSYGRYVIENKEYYLDIAESRLICFGIDLRKFTLTDKFLDLVLDYIKSYEDEYMIHHPDGKELKEKGK